MATDILDEVLSLEEQFYQEGYNLGVADGTRAGYTEGAVFAVEKSFEKLLQLGRLYGKALVWNQRLINSSIATDVSSCAEERETEMGKEKEKEEEKIDTGIVKSMPALHQGSRLAKNIQTLLALVDPATLVLQNSEEAVSDVEERLKGALTKAKLIERVLGEPVSSQEGSTHAKDAQITGGDGSGSIEDISSLHVRR